ncbi:MAG: polyketide cyclase [Bdellovibrionales bacterium CG10_big_fil_rev_8_21_14_0_10_45_34]|nr:MAG: polyketide cyclase [Bdellovibrionales bacterium CG10_big_fil_rev_8_21_14_0_10_45_34]
MASASTTELFNCKMDQFFTVIHDYEKYSEFLSEVKSCKVIRRDGNKALVEYQINMVKSFSYQMWMVESPPDSITWSFAEGDLFKTSSGSWKLQDEAGKTRATYTVEATFKTFVPGPIAKALIQVNLPNMMSAYHKRVSELYGG